MKKMTFHQLKIAAMLAEIRAHARLQAMRRHAAAVKLGGL